MKPVRVSELERLAAELFGPPTTFQPGGIGVNQLARGSWHAIAHGPAGEVRVWCKSEVEVKRALYSVLVGLLALREHNGRLIVNKNEILNITLRKDHP